AGENAEIARVDDVGRGQRAAVAEDGANRAQVERDSLDQAGVLDMAEIDVRPWGAGQSGLAVAAERERDDVDARVAKGLNAAHESRVLAVVPEVGDAVE